MIKKIQEKFGDKVDIFEKNKKRFYISLKKEDLKEVIKFVFEGLGGRFSIASGVDTKSRIEILYHMTMDRAGVIISLKTFAEKPNPEVPSVSDIIEGAAWIEREIHELLGVDFVGHPGLKRLLLADDWPEGVYPLRKEFKLEEREY